MINNLINEALKNGIDLEVSEKNTQSVDISTLNDKLKSYQVGNNTNYALKAIKGDNFVTITTNDISNTDRIIDNLNSIFSMQDNENKNRLCEGNIVNDNELREKLDYNAIKNEMLALNKEILSKYNLVASIETYYSHYNNGYRIENKNAKLVDSCNFNEYASAITVKNNELSRISYVSYYSITYDFKAFKDKVYKAIDDLLIKLNSDSVKTNKYNVILKNNVVASLLNAFSDMFSSRDIDMKESVLTDKFNKQVFNKNITIVEDPCGESTIINRLFDSEGTKTYYKEIVKDGVFVKKINDLEYALKNNEEPTGNSYGVNNMYILPGNCSYNDLVSELKDGIIIDEVIGLHAGINHKNGDISLQAEGFMVKDGKITNGLNMIILSSNLFEILGNVVNIASDLSNDSADVRAPSLLLSDITITGKK